MIKVGLIGCGFMGGMHAACYAALEELGVKAVDDKTFEVTLTLPCDFLLGLMAFPSFFPLNQEFFEAQGDQFALSPDNMIFCGPYNMTGWEQGNSCLLYTSPSPRDRG